ncbi:MAG: DUF1127 domain-containing protein [Acetobacteraceae bacterium]|nr:DUF1127 domain-containing protein [Acetobacteraceae bacterium]
MDTETMDPRITPAEAALLMPLPRSSQAERIEAIIATARRERDAAIAARIVGGFRAIRRFLTTLRRRDETIAALRQLDDRQLYDVGVLRGNIPAAANDLVGPRRAA